MIPLLFILLLPAQALEPETVAGIVPDTFDLSGHTVVLSVDDGYHSVYENIYPLLRKYDMPITLALIGGCISSGRPSYRPQERFMNKAEIREMIDSCDIEIASHTMTHAWLTRVDSATAWREIALSKTYIESLFDVPVVTFVYPYGDMDARARRMVRAAGYRMARAVRGGDPDLWVDPYRIPEIELRIETGLPAILHRVRHHKVTVILLHRIVRRPTVFTEWPLDDFAELLGWLHRRNVHVTTLSGLYREWWQERLARTLIEQLEASQKAGAVRLFEDVDVDATRTPHTR